ncbi:hypothetical protein KM539_15245 [Xanthomonas translucens pv. poae]|uniref:hypothetical protein n=1 Tax=Xanthomonas graminis TaxID=3390026 RepID=UPI001112F011|nr:hypothetical protein [Xanthomonas translucens]UKE61115.1 hypothetical protein KM539_15245 [Xanthomonas translucens pv. poae]
MTRDLRGVQTIPAAARVDAPAWLAIARAVAIAAGPHHREGVDGAVGLLAVACRVHAQPRRHLRQDAGRA